MRYFYDIQFQAISTNKKLTSQDTLFSVIHFEIYFKEQLIYLAHNI